MRCLLLGKVAAAAVAFNVVYMNEFARPDVARCLADAVRVFRHGIALFHGLRADLEAVGNVCDRGEASTEFAGQDDFDGGYGFYFFESRRKHQKKKLREPKQQKPTQKKEKQTQSSPCKRSELGELRNARYKEDERGNQGKVVKDGFRFE